MSRYDDESWDEEPSEIVVPETPARSVIFVHTDKGTKEVDANTFKLVQREVAASEELAKKMQALYDALANKKISWFKKLITKSNIQLYKWKIRK